jgi:hypothetical protein
MFRGSNVRNLPTIVFAALLTLSATALLAEPIPIVDPGKYTADLMQTFSTKGTRDAAATIVGAIGRPDALDKLRQSLEPLDGKKYDVTQKIIDRDYNNAMRQIVYYAHVVDVGFVYFRFNFKMTGAGWRLVNFTFKEETNELFPKDFTDR